MICPECNKTLTNEKDCYGHDCEVMTQQEKSELYLSKVARGELR